MVNKKKFLLKIVLLFFIVFFVRICILSSNYVTSSSMTPSLLTGDGIVSLKFVYGVNIPFTNRKFFALEKPSRGDIVIFSLPEREIIKKNGFEYLYDNSDDEYVKRVVGLPGDKIKIIDGIIYINGVKIKRKKEMIRAFYTINDKKWHKFNGVVYFEKIGKNIIRTLDIIPFPADEKNFGINKYGKITYKKEFILKPYVVPENMYFVIGDNRGDSEDSRFFGPVPFEKIKGKPWFKWYSLNAGSLKFIFEFIK